ncbi:hypothetical protein ACFC4G_41215 [Streptomyces sp. NPDC056002]|uniref:hypothetical protein n=1 Tax=Streptomyces sp. NPDC056002 TaxID=3345675 RepID=UPI0035D78BBE
MSTRGAAAPPVRQPTWPARAPALDALERLLRLTASAAGRHAAVPRAAGLLHSPRSDDTDVHRRTPLGDTLMNGAR